MTSQSICFDCGCLICWT